MYMRIIRISSLNYKNVHKYPVWAFLYIEGGKILAVAEYSLIEPIKAI